MTPVAAMLVVAVIAANLAAKVVLMAVMGPSDRTLAAQYAPLSVVLVTSPRRGFLLCGF